MASLEGARRHERFGQVNLPAVFSRAWLAWCHAELGTFAEGRALGEEGLRIAEAVQAPMQPYHAPHGVSGLLSLRQGDLHQALPLLERAWPSVRTRLAGLVPRDRRGLGRGVYPVRAPRRGRAAAHAGDGAVTMTTELTARLSGRSLAERGLSAGRPPGGGAARSPSAPSTLARTHQERGHQAYALRLLGEHCRAARAPGG